jgi:hypothetical protein
MNKRRVATAALGAIALVAALGLAPGGVARAAAQANQEWFGAEANGYGYYLGDSSGGGRYHGHIHTFNAPDKCLDVPGDRFFYTDSIAPYTPFLSADPSGATVQLWDCEPQTPDHGFGANQWWVQVDNGDGSWSFTIRNDTGLYCLDAVPPGVAGYDYNGNPVVVNACQQGTTSQAWTIGPQGQLQSVRFPGYCLDDTGWGRGNGTPLQVYPCQYD